MSRNTRFEGRIRKWKYTRKNSEEKKSKEKFYWWDFTQRTTELRRETLQGRLVCRNVEGEEENDVSKISIWSSGRKKEKISINISRMYYSKAF